MAAPLKSLLNLINDQSLWTDHLTFKRGEFVKQGDTIDTNLYFVKSGTVRIYILEDGSEQDIRFGYRDSIVAALDSFLTGSMKIDLQQPSRRRRNQNSVGLAPCPLSKTIWVR